MHIQTVSGTHTGSTMTKCTGGVSRVDDAEAAGNTVLLGFIESSPELLHIQNLAAALIQVVVDLHGTQVCQGG